MLIDPPHGTDHAQRELRSRHFHAEHRCRFFEVQRDVFHNIHCQRGFTHRRPRRNHDQFALLQAGGHAIQIDVAGGKTDHIILVLAAVEHVNALHGLGQQRIYFHEALFGFGANLGDLEHLGLGLVDQYARVPPRGVVG